MKLYPMKIVPVTEKSSWGGRRIYDLFGIGSPEECQGKAELITSHAKIANGEFAGLTVNQLAARFGEELLGRNRKTFPYTLKLVDTHSRRTPRQRHSLRMEGMFEHYDVMLMLHAEPYSGIYAGIREKLNREEFIRRAGERNLYQTMHFYPARAGELFLLPGGLLHAQGGGVLSLVLSVGVDEKQTEEAKKPEEIWELLDSSIRGIKYAGKILLEGDAEVRKTEFGTGLVWKMVYLKGQRRVETGGEKISALFVMDGQGEIALGGERLPIRRGDAILVPAQAEEIALSGDMIYCYFA